MMDAEWEWTQKLCQPISVNLVAYCSVFCALNKQINK